MKTISLEVELISAQVMEGNQATPEDIQATPEDMKEKHVQRTITGNETQEQQKLIAEKITEKEPKVLLFERPRLAT